MLHECLSCAQTGLSGDGTDAANSNLWCALRPVDRHLDHFHEVCCVLQGWGSIPRCRSSWRWCSEPIGTACIDGHRMLFQISGFARNRRRAVDKWKKLGHSVSACSGQNRVEQNSVGIFQYVMFNPGFAPICRTLACFFAPTYRANCAAVDRGTRPINLIQLPQFM